MQRWTLTIFGASSRRAHRPALKGIAKTLLPRYDTRNDTVMRIAFGHPKNTEIRSTDRTSKEQSGLLLSQGSSVAV